MIPLPNQIKIIQKKDNKNNAIFEISPFYPGYGTTIANSYRRVLLSSLKGSAITEVKIDGVNHEFSTLPGILEDVLIILLNLKKIRFRNWSDEAQNIVLEEKGEKEVLAKDFKLNPQIEIVNPEIYIATLTDKKAKLRIEAKVENGIGYIPVEEREQKKLEAGVISIDAIYSPIKKVNFKIENVIVGKRMDFEKLDLEIETDGTITPEQAFVDASNILIQHFSFCSNIELKNKDKGEDKKEDKEGNKKKTQVKKKEK